MATLWFLSHKVYNSAYYDFLQVISALTVDSNYSSDSESVASEDQPKSIAHATFINQPKTNPLDWLVPVSHILRDIGSFAKI